jgi:hypothetical protein
VRVGGVLTVNGTSSCCPKESDVKQRVFSQRLSDVQRFERTNTQQCNAHPPPRLRPRQDFTLVLFVFSMRVKVHQRVQHLFLA